MSQARPVPSQHDERTAALAAVEVLVLWSGEPAGAAAPSGGAGVWPLFVLVVDEENDAAGTGWLVDYLDGSRAGEPAAVDRCRWSVTNPGKAALTLSVRMRAPVDRYLEIHVPAECFLGMRDLAARGATIGLTTRRLARRIAVRADKRADFEDVLLLGCRTSGEFARLTDLACDLVRQAR